MFSTDPNQQSFAIEFDAKPLTSHWEHMRRADEHLAEVLLDLQAINRMELGEADADDYDRFGFVFTDDDHEGQMIQMDKAADAVDGWALEVQTAKWTYSRVTGQSESLARVIAVLGTGGPHVEVEFLFAPNGRPEKVELRRYWSEKDSATTDDPQALRIVEDFCAAFLVVE